MRQKLKNLKDVPFSTYYQPSHCFSMGIYQYQTGHDTILGERQDYHVIAIRYPCKQLQHQFYHQRSQEDSTVMQLQVAIDQYV